MAAGYSGTPLVKKLGFAPDMSVVLLNAPRSFSELLGEIPSGVKVSRRLGPADVVLIFAQYAADLATRVLALKSAVAPDGMVWVVWPKAGEQDADRSDRKRHPRDCAPHRPGRRQGLRN
jgi:hypothetical protein